jgi:hypothetical protein
MADTKNNEDSGRIDNTCHISEADTNNDNLSVTGSIEPNDISDADTNNDVTETIQEDDETNLESILTEDLITDLDTNDNRSVIGSETSFIKYSRGKRTFKERCNADPDFYQRCKDKLNRKVICETCEKEISRSSVHTHNRSKKHIELFQLKLDAEARAKVKYDIIKELDYIRNKLLKPDKYE